MFLFIFNAFCLMWYWSGINIAKPPSFWLIFVWNIFSILLILVFLYSYFILLCKQYIAGHFCEIHFESYLIGVLIPTISQLSTGFTFNVNNDTFKHGFEFTTLLLFHYLHHSFYVPFLSFIGIFCFIKVFYQFVFSFSLLVLFF